MVSNNEINKMLADTIHKCLMCNEDAYEVKKDKYECSSCAFTWTVVHCE